MLPLRWLLSAVLLLAIASVFGVAPSPAAATDTITVGAAASGSRRVLHRGDRLVVRLSSNPSTGYAWRIRSGTGRVLALASRAYVPPADGARLGAPGTAVLRLRAIGRGSTLLGLTYARSWETGVAPARTFTLRVTVR